MSDPDTKQMTTTGHGAPPIKRPSIEGVESALLDNDLSKLSPQQRVQYMEKVCESVGLNPLTKPFRYIRLNGQLTLYATRDAAEQLRKVHGISITNLEETWREDLCIFRAYAEDADGRTDVATGAVDTSRSSGQQLANDIMKAETKAKRRVTLSLAGLGWLDETEISDIPDGATEEVNVDYQTGEVQEQKSHGWYRDAIEWLGEKAVEIMDADKVIASFSEVPSKHPVDDWPTEYGEQAVEHVKEAVQRASNDEMGTGEPAEDPNDTAGKATRGPSGQSSQSQKSAPSGTNPPQNGGAAKASGTDGGSDRQPAQSPSQAHDPSPEEPQEARYDGPQDALQSNFDEAWQSDSRDWGSISDAQLNRMYAIAYDYGWSDAALNRLVKDELGYESKADVPYGDPYDEICEALEDERLRYHMSRDPDTKDLFEGEGDAGGDEDELPF